MMEPQPFHQDFQQGVFARLQEWRRNMQLVDTLIVCQSKTIGAHRIILASTMPYFEKMFLSDTPGQQRTRKVHLDQLDPTSLLELIDFVYTGNLYITKDNIEAIIRTASFLEMQDVKNSCVRSVLQSIINPSNCLGWKRLAVAVGDREFSTKCDEFIRGNVANVVRSPEAAAIIQLNVDLHLDAVYRGVEEENRFFVQKVVPSIIRLIRELTCSSSKKLLLLSESTLSLHSLDGITVSLNDDMEDTQQNSPLCTSPVKLDSLASARHLDLGGEEEDAEVWREIALVQTSATAFTVFAALSLEVVSLNITASMADYPVSPTSETMGSLGSSLEFVASTNESRSSSGAVTIDGTMYIVGGYNRNACLATVEQYNHSINRWHYAGKMTSKRGRCAAVSVDNCIYALGGSDGHRELNSMEVYSVDTNEWKLVGTPMIKGRSSFGAVAVGTSVYVLGGVQQSYSLPCMERYDTKTQTWFPAPSMEVCRNDLAVVAIDMKIYAVGGEQGASGCVASVECYDIKTESWETVASLKSPRRGACAVAFDNKIYVFGGCTGATVLNSVEIYNPKENTWCLGAPMTLPRCNLAAGMLSGQIMITGGFTGTTFLNTTELYNPLEDQWTSFI